MSDVQPSYWRAISGARGTYNLILCTALGSTVWHSFIGGPTAYKALPRQQFGHLQSRLFPRFFALQTSSALALLGLYARGGGKVSWTGWWRSGSDRTVQALMLLVLTGAANWIVVGPWTTAVMKRRHRKERIEGKDYSDPDASSEMKALNSRFAFLHSVSSILNLGWLVTAAAHAAFVAEYGTTRA
ncbi:hypothetical protein NBRC10513v2_001010 [Rhodotorula toruloides]